jgi:signal transduction histidine kinase
LNCRYLFIIFFFTAFNVFSQSEELNIQLDSIAALRNLSKDQNLELEMRLDYAKKASQLSLETKIDSTILMSNRNLSFVYLQMGKFNQFGTINHTNLNLAHKLNDSSAIAITNYNLGAYHHNELNNDSAYYYYSNAVKIYNKLKDIKSEGELLLNMADIQETEKDYIGAEINAIRAILLIEILPKTDNNLDTLWSLYNLLGVISGRLQQYDDAIDYHEQALSISNKISGNFYYNLSSNNNLAFIYEKKGEYLKALSIYEDLIQQDNLYQNDPSLYTLLLGNIANTKSLSNNNNYEEIEKQFKEAYKISDSIEDDVVKMAISEYFSEFLFSRSEKDSALFYAEKTYKISKELKSNDFVSKSLLLLSKINEGEVGKKYLYEHIKLNDSLLNNERNIRNKFARIEFETDKIEAENIKISKERLLFLLLSIGLLLTLTLLYIVITQRAKNRKLEFAQKQQEANEEIYNLMLAQQDKVDEGRTQEKKRISEELHDGILGRLFGTRLSLDSLNMLQTEDAIINREGYINELKSIEEEIRKISHDLNADFVVGSSFIDIVKTLIETQTQAYKLDYTFNEDNDIPWDDVSNKTKIHVYRMLQETIQNIYKHANAKHIKISFKLKNNVILLTVEDDGSGFNVVKAKKGIGIKNINSRVKEMNGEVEINSQIGIGTIIKINAPLN